MNLYDARGYRANTGETQSARITEILRPAILLLTELKVYLNDIVTFFKRVHAFVEQTLKAWASEFFERAEEANTNEGLDHLKSVRVLY